MLKCNYCKKILKDRRGVKSHFTHIHAGKPVNYTDLGDKTLLEPNLDIKEPILEPIGIPIHEKISIENPFKEIDEELNAGEVTETNELMNELRQARIKYQIERYKQKTAKLKYGEEEDYIPQETDGGLDEIKELLLNSKGEETPEKDDKMEQMVMEKIAESFLKGDIKPKNQAINPVVNEW